MTPQQVFTHEDVLNVLRDLVQIMSTQKAAAEHLGVNPDHLCNILKGRRRVNKTILKKLGYEKVVVYRSVEPDWRDKK